MSIVVGYDATHANIAHIPKGAQAAGYTTGSASIAWTAADWAAHPGAIRIDQDAAASDPTADVLDVEQGAATFSDCPGWVKRAIRDFDAVTRPGQRWPCIYASASALTSVANALIAGGVTRGVYLWVAKWSLDQSQAIALITNAEGPFPIAGVQFDSGSFTDTDVWSKAWVDNVSAKKPDGPFAHFSTAGQTIGDLSSSRNMKSVSWAANQAAINPGDAEKLLDAATVKTGSRWWTRTP